MLHLKIVSKQDIMFNIRDVVLIKSVCQNKTLLKIRGVDDGFIVDANFDDVKKMLNVSPQSRNRSTVSLKLA